MSPHTVGTEPTQGDNARKLPPSTAGASCLRISFHSLSTLVTRPPVPANGLICCVAVVRHSGELSFGCVSFLVSVMWEFVLWRQLLRVWPDIQYLPTTLQHLHNRHEMGAMGFEWTILSTS